MHLPDAEAGGHPPFLKKIQPANSLEQLMTRSHIYNVKFSSNVSETVPELLPVLPVWLQDAYGSLVSSSLTQPKHSPEEVNDIKIQCNSHGATTSETCMINKLAFPHLKRHLDKGS